MSKVSCNGKVQTGGVLFSYTRQQYGAQAVRQGRNFGGTVASVLIGPDLYLPGGTSNNPPTATGSVWDTHPVAGLNVAFNEDSTNTWIRGHMVNGEWGGSGSSWTNLVPLTSAANSHHKTVEQYMRAFCIASAGYESAAFRNDWYGVAYLVQSSTDPWAGTPANTNLYSYAPNFIKVSWRAVRVPKPNLPNSSVPGYLMGLGLLTSVAVLPFAAPVRPTAIAGATTPATNAAGGAVFAAPMGFPAAMANGFDGDIEIHQS